MAQTNTSAINFLGYSGYGYLITSTSSNATTYTVSYTAGFYNSSYFYKGSDYVYAYVNATGQSQQSGNFSVNSKVSAGSHTIRTGSFSWSKGTANKSVTVSDKTSFNGSSGSTSQSFTVPALSSYSVSYNANGGSGAPATQTKYYDIDLVLSSVIPTKEGYTFVNWNTSADGTGTTYASGATYTGNAALTLYAQWKINYIKPTIENLSVYRTDSTGTADDAGTSAIVKFNWKAGLDGVNTLIPEEIYIGFYVPPTSGMIIPITAYKDTNITTTSGTINQIIGSSDLSTDDRYIIVVRITDSIGQNKKTTFISTSFFPIDITEDGTGIAFGKAATANKFECNPPAQFNENINTTGNIDITGNYLINGKSFGYKEPIDITSSIHSTNGWTATNDGVAQFYLEPQGSANECAEYYKDLTIDVYVGVVRTYKGGIGVSTFPIVAGHIYKRVYNSTYIDKALVRFYEFNR